MIRRLGVVCLLLGVASAACGDAVSRLRRELRREHRRRRRGMTVEQRWAEQTKREIEAWHRYLARREAVVASEYRTEASLIYLDRERAAHRDPFALLRERNRRLAAERRRIFGLDYYDASDYRLGSETQLMAHRRGFGPGVGYDLALQRAEQWAMESAADLVWREHQRRQAIIRRVMALAERMEKEAQAKKGQPPKKSAFRRFLDFVTQPFRRKK